MPDVRYHMALETGFRRGKLVLLGTPSTMYLFKVLLLFVAFGSCFATNQKWTAKRRLIDFYNTKPLKANVKEEVKQVRPLFSSHQFDQVGIKYIGMEQPAHMVRPYWLKNVDRFSNKLDLL